ncbi:MAG: MATE family efflux transporter [Clostridia bacterium]|nr:MATE family efflux transporter [Clostridia bacterium]
MRSKNVDMLSGSITKGLLSLSVPIMIMNVMQSMFNIVDMTVLKWFSDGSAVGAVGASGTLISLCTSLLIGIAAGANVVIARRIGSGDREAADRAVMTSILVAIFGGVLLMLIGAIFAEDFLVMTNCHESLLSQAVLYFKIYFYGVPILMLYNFLASILRAIGDTKKPMYFLIIGGMVKFVCTIVFVALFDMDVEGVGFATIISNSVALILAFKAVLDSKDIVSVNFGKIAVDLFELKEILFIGIPAGMQSAMYSIANVLITSVVNSFGAAATTGISIANQFDGIMYQISYAPSLATIPYVSQNIGAGNIKRVKQTVIRAVLITVSFGATFGGLSAVFSSQLSSIMSSSSEVIAFSCQKMIIISSTYFISGINEVIGGALKGMGKPIFPAVATFAYMCVFRFIWVYAIYPLCPNLTFLYLVWPIGWILSIITLLVPYFIAMHHLEAHAPEND